MYFDGSSAAMNMVSEAPEVGDDGRSITLTYDSPPRSDWELSLERSTVPPAHVVAQRALGIEDPQEAKDAFIAAFQDNNTEDLSKIAKVWNEDFNFTSLPDDEGLYLSNGAFVISDFVENQYLTLTANEDFDWGPAAQGRQGHHPLLGGPAGLGHRAAER